MSNINKQALNQEKIEWLNKLADMEYCKSNPGHWLMSLKDTNMLAKLALRSVALLDELEAKDKSWAAQDDHINQQADRIESLEKKNGELGRALGAADRRIAELEASHGNLREAMAGIHNTITGGGAYTPLSAILNASKRAYDESAAAAGKGE